MVNQNEGTWISIFDRDRSKHNSRAHTRITRDDHRTPRSPRRDGSAYCGREDSQTYQVNSRVIFVAPPLFISPSQRRALQKRRETDTLFVRAALNSRSEHNLDEAETI